MLHRRHFIGALIIAVIAGCATAVFEIIKDLIHRDQTIFQSHEVTVLFAGGLAFVITVVVRRREEMLQTQYKHLFERANDAILVFDSQSEVILDANDEACKLYEIDRPELIGTSITTLTKDIAKGKKQIAELLERGICSPFESVHQTKTGQEISLLINFSTLLPLKEDRRFSASTATFRNASGPSTRFGKAKNG